MKLDDLNCFRKQFERPSLKKLPLILSKAEADFLMEKGVSSSNIKNLGESDFGEIYTIIDSSEL